VGLHYVRTKDNAEVDFALSEKDTLTHLIECKLHDTKLHPALNRFAAQWNQAKAVQLIRECHVESEIHGVALCDASKWLSAIDS
jgi:hypothetical protein